MSVERQYQRCSTCADISLPNLSGLLKEIQVLGTDDPDFLPGVPIADVGQRFWNPPKHRCGFCHNIFSHRLYSSCSAQSRHAPLDDSHTGDLIVGSSLQLCYRMTNGADTGRFPVVRHDTVVLFLVPLVADMAGSSHGHGSVTTFSKDGILKSAIVGVSSLLACFEVGEEQRILGAWSSSASFDPLLVAGWIHQCDTGHQGCRKQSRSPISLNLIDCQRRQLVELESSVSYAALSYVWGGVETGPLAPHRSLPPRTPRVIEDAIEIALRLGYRYLWVDQYCVEQHNRTERQEQLGSMHRVYNDADITIVAAVGHDANCGLPRIHTDLQAERNELVYMSGYILMPVISGVLPQIESSRWNTRGWTFQETYMSRRLLVFTEQDVYYECAFSSMSESFAKIIPSSDDIVSEASMDEFGSLINGPNVRCRATSFRRSFTSFTRQLFFYTSRNLTFGHDAINAFTAILKNYEEKVQSYNLVNLSSSMLLQNGPAMQVNIVQGLPFYHMTNDLVHGGPHPFTIAALSWRHHIRESTIGRAPGRRNDFSSWSWAGWDGTARWNLNGSFPYEYMGYCIKDLWFEHHPDEGSPGKEERRLSMKQAKKAARPLLCFASSDSFPLSAISSLRKSGVLNSLEIYPSISLGKETVIDGLESGIYELLIICYMKEKVCGPGNPDQYLCCWVVQVNSAFCERIAVIDASVKQSAFLEHFGARVFNYETTNSSISDVQAFFEVAQDIIDTSKLVQWRFG